jgi:hypothetical protein
LYGRLSVSAPELKIKFLLNAFEYCEGRPQRDAPTN